MFKHVTVSGKTVRYRPDSDALLDWNFKRIPVWCAVLVTLAVVVITLGR